MESNNDRFQKELDIVLSMSSNYDLIVKYELTQSPEQKKIELGCKKEKKCRFCGRTSPEVTFKKIAHAIPEFLGNKKLFSHFECDSCNDKFSMSIENHFANYLSIWRTLTRIPGKKSVPSYKDKATGNRIDVKSGKISIEQYMDKPIITDNENDKSVTVHGVRDAYVPAAVFKCLVKMALTIMPEEEMKYFHKTIAWVNETDHSKVHTPKLLAWFSVTPGPNPHPSITNYLYRRRSDADDNVFYMLYVVTFKNFMYEVYLPFSSEDEHLFGKKVVLHRHLDWFPSSYEYGKTQYDILDLTPTTEVKREPISITMRYREKVEVDNEALDEDGSVQQ